MIGFGVLLCNASHPIPALRVTNSFNNLRDKLEEIYLQLKHCCSMENCGVNRFEMTATSGWHPPVDAFNRQPRRTLNKVLLQKLYLRNNSSV